MLRHPSQSHQAKGIRYTLCHFWRPQCPDLGRFEGLLEAELHFATSERYSGQGDMRWVH